MIKINFPKIIKKNKKKIRNIATLFLLAPALLMPTFAESDKPVENNSTKVEKNVENKTNPNTFKAPVFSQWATKDLNEAQFSGLFPAGKFLDGTDFRKEITLEDAKSAYSLAKKKLEDRDIKTSGDFEFKNLTRLEVLNSISKLLNKNEFNLKDLQNAKIFFGSSDEKYLNTKMPLQEMLALYTRTVNNRLQSENKVAKGYFYEVKNKDNKIYMLGSIHVGTNKMYPIRKEITDALKESSKIYMEVDLTNPNASKIMQEAIYYKDENTLKADLGDELYAKIVKIFGNFGLKEEDIAKMRPWAVYNSISMDQTGGPGNSMFGVESYFLLQALLNGIEVGELESIEFQRDLLFGIDKDIYISLIKELVEEIEKNGYKNINKSLDNMFEAWIKSEKTYIKNEFKKDGQDEANKKFNRALVDTRDKNMANEIEKLLNQDGKNTYFVLVGAAHLVPDDSVTGILKDKGFEVVEK